MARVSLKQIKTYVEALLSERQLGSAISVDVFRHQIKDIVVRLTASQWGEPFKEVEVYYPASWWQHLKHATYMCKWTRWLFGYSPVGRFNWQTRFPVRTKSESMKADVIYPRVQPRCCDGPLKDYYVMVSRWPLIPVFDPGGSAPPMVVEDAPLEDREVTVELTPEEAEVLVETIYRLDIGEFLRGEQFYSMMRRLHEGARAAMDARGY
jgi:hypothetical protein